MTNSSVASVVEQALRIARAEPHDLLVIAGPTASGKTALAVELAERLDGEVISADSIQIYRAFDVGSGKPTADELARVRHHMVGVLDPMAPSDAVTWAEAASAAIADMRSRGRVPIVCGGTFLWIKTLIFGLAAAPGASEKTRSRHRAIATESGRPALHALLRTVDPDCAARIHPNDFVRVSRALEVHELTGRPMSRWHEEHGFSNVRHRARLMAIAHEPGELTDRIATRTASWLEEGWVEEVQGLLSAGYGGARAMGSVGYAQVRAALEGRLAHADLPAAIVRATRVFARRQRTWLRNVDVAWLR